MFKSRKGRVTGAVDFIRTGFYRAGQTAGFYRVKVEKRGKNWEEKSIGGVGEINS